MAIYELNQDHLRKIEETSFVTEKISERGDLQRLLRNQIDIIAADSLVISEEFGGWEESKRRIDLLAVDTDANLVVIELKRTEDGGHMELQAIRYAAMVSTMTFDRAVDVFSAYLQKLGQDIDPRQTLLEFLNWEEPEHEQFASDVRIVLASAEFSIELTTAVMWLNERDLDIRCVRMKPYTDNGRLLLDVQQVIPLPEAEDYQVSMRERKLRERGTRRSNRDYTKYDVIVDGQRFEKLAKRNAVHRLVTALVAAGHSPEPFNDVVNWKRNFFRTFEGTLNSADATEQLPPSNDGKKRWFSDEGEIIHYENKSYVLSNQWGRLTAKTCLLYTSPSPRDATLSRMPSSA